MPSPGLILGLRAAAGPGIRDDGGVVAGYTVPVFYDSMIAKLIAWAPTRGEAVARMSRALAEYQVLGIRTTIPFFLWLLRQPDYLEGRYDTTYLDRVLAERRGESFSQFSEAETESIAMAAALDTYLRGTAGGRPAARRRRRGARGPRSAAARRCGDDVRGRSRRPHVQRRGRADRSRRAGSA